MSLRLQGLEVKGRVAAVTPRQDGKGGEESRWSSLWMACILSLSRSH